ncbi:MAG TPA: hypothetical protein VFV49_07955 [Thermoanaerobaculia bacterium]|nr:hypothetical protein [Thermoanaerobaculia bacterium]
MRNRNAQDCRCSYVVVVESAAASTSDLRELGNYLSTLGTAGCDVVVLDPSPRMLFELNGRILRWVARHVAVRPEHCTSAGTLDRLRAAASVAACEKVIVASEDVRYIPAAIAQLCDLLETHEVVEPQDYLEPLPWWGSIEAGRILVHRGIEPQPDHGATFGFRRGTVRALRALNLIDEQDPARRLISAGAEVYAASDVFVRREPGAFNDWLEERPRIAGNDFSLPFKSAFFFSLVPFLLLLGILGGVRLAGVYAGIIAFVSIGLALRGRAGASSFFPFRACFFAPLWVLERSVSVYWALFRKLRGVEPETVRIALPDSRGAKVASGR